MGGTAHLCFLSLSLSLLGLLASDSLPPMYEREYMCVHADECVCVYLFVCVYAPVCSGMLGQALHYGAHDFFPEKHASPFLKSASSSDRQLAVSPAVCMSVHVCICDICRSVCVCMCAFIYVWQSLCMCACTDIHIHTHTRLHTYAYTPTKIMYVSMHLLTCSKCRHAKIKAYPKPQALCMSVSLTDILTYMKTCKHTGIHHCMSLCMFVSRESARARARLRGRASARETEGRRVSLARESTRARKRENRLTYNDMAHK